MQLPLNGVGSVGTVPSVMRDTVCKHYVLVLVAAFHCMSLFT